MSEAFAADWLALREGFDAASRSPDLAARFAAALPARPKLIDLGAGTGSLFRWLAPRIARPQHWTLADADPVLLARALDGIATWGEARGYRVVDRGRSLTLRTPDGPWDVSVRLADLAQEVPLEGQNAVVCSALLDLASRAWLGRLAAALRVPLLACLSVDGHDTWLPRHPTDRAVRSGFRRDQGQDKGFGPALGTGAPAVLHAALRARGFTVESASTEWRVPGNASVMLAALLEFHARAALRRMPGHTGEIEAWYIARRRQIQRQRLAIRIGHRDSLALPPAR